MKAVLGKPGPRNEEASLDVTTLSYKTANQSPDRRSLSRTQLTDQDADVADKVIVDYQQSLQAMSDLSQKIRLSKNACLKGDLRLLSDCLRTEKVCLSDKI